MRIGMFGGKFMPLHIGHLYCIDVASKQCDKVYAILFANGNDEENILKSNNDPSLSLESRFNCLKKVCELYDNVEPLIIDCKDCRYEDGSENWDAETPLVRAYIPKMYRVYSSEISYGNYFSRAYPEAEHIVVDAKREKYPISATMIRAMKTLEEKEKWIVGN